MCIRDRVLGSYYLTIIKEGAKGEGMRFSSFNEALLAYFHGEVELQARIKIYLDPVRCDVSRHIF